MVPGGGNIVKTLVRAFGPVGLLAAATLTQADGLSTRDYVEIGQLYARYNHAIDSGDATGWAATFIPDGQFQQLTGTEALKGFVRNWVDARNGANLRHWNSNLLITPTSAGANASVMLMLLNVGAKPAAIAATGMYTDTLVRTEAGWRFASRAVKIDAPAPTAEAKPLEKH